MDRMKFFMLFLCVFMLSCASFQGMRRSAGSVCLIRNSRAQAVLFLPEHASETLLNAAHTLVDTLYQSSNARLPIRVYTPHACHAQIAIHLGITAYVSTLGLPLDRLDADGFFISFPHENAVVIVGPTDWGTEFGVYEFLERYVGVRWLLPGPDGVHVPALATVMIPRRDVREEPAFFSRQLGGLRGDEQTRWARRNRLHGRIEFHHNLSNLFPPDQYKTTHPEFFPLVDGKRYFPPPHRSYRWQPCFSAPGIVEEAIKNITHYFAQHPEASSYSLGINDTGQHCECEHCVARDRGTKNFLGRDDVSDRYFEWANAVVEGVLDRYPDKWFGCLAYHNVAQPPSRVPVHPRIIPYMTYDRMKWIDAEIEAEGKKITELWEKQVPILGWYDYIYGTPYLLPRVYFHKMAAYYRYGYQHGVRAMYAEAYPNWGEGPKLYLALKLMWNPSLDVDSVLEDWFICAVGKHAAPYLAAYYAHWENFWTDRIKNSMWFTREGQYLPFKRPDYLYLVTYDDLAKSRELLTQTLDLTETPPQRARARLLLRAFEYYEASTLSYLGLIKCLRQPGKPREYYEKMEERRLALLNEFEQHSVLRHPLRFDRPKFPLLQWGTTANMNMSVFEPVKSRLRRIIRNLSP